MRIALFVFIALMLGACAQDDYSAMGIRNKTEVPIFALPYVADYTSGAWIQPGLTDDFYTIDCDCLDGYDYFSFYYDSLVIFLEGMETHPIKFFKDGSTVNYDPTKNPFTNQDVWVSWEYDGIEPGNQESVKQRSYTEHFFVIETSAVKILSDTLWTELNPAF